MPSWKDPTTQLHRLYCDKSQALCQQRTHALGFTSSGISLLLGQSRRGEHSPATFLHYSAHPVEQGAKQMSLNDADDVRLHLSGHISHKADSLWVKQSDIEVKLAWNRTSSRSGTEVKWRYSRSDIEIS